MNFLIGWILFYFIFFIKKNYAMKPNIFNIRILTMNRPQSLTRMLSSLKLMRIENHTVNIEFFIDAVPITNTIDINTINIIKNFVWAYGEKTFKTNPINKGLNYQWMKPYYSKAPLLILEDDIVLCKYFFDFAQSALHNIANNSQKNIFGVSFQNLRLILKDDNCPNFETNKFLSNNVNLNSTFFLMQMSTWAPIVFSDKWNELINFYKQCQLMNITHCIPGSISNLWYETSGSFMQFFLYIKQYFLMYFYLGKPIIINKFENGLHFKNVMQEKNPICEDFSKIQITFNQNVFYDQGFNIYTSKNISLESFKNKSRTSKICKYKPKKVIKKRGLFPKVY